MRQRNVRVVMGSVGTADEVATLQVIVSTPHARDRARAAWALARHQR